MRAENWKLLNMDLIATYDSTLIYLDGGFASNNFDDQIQ